MYFKLNNDIGYTGITICNLGYGRVS